MSAVSISPALAAWMRSTRPGARHVTVVCATCETATSDWPIPTVSTMTGSKPHRASIAIEMAAAGANPPAIARLGRERRKAVGGELGHPDAVTEKRSTGTLRGRIDRQHCRPLRFDRILGEQPGHQAGLADPGRARDPDDPGLGRVQPPDLGYQRQRDIGTPLDLGEHS